MKLANRLIISVTQRNAWKRRILPTETDSTNKCRRLNPGKSQDGSLSLNHRLPALPANPLLSPLGSTVTNLSIPLHLYFCLRPAFKQFATCLLACGSLV